MEQEKLYSPVNFYLRDKYEAAEGQYDDIHYWRDELSHEDAFGYMAEIKAALADDRRNFDNGRGLAEYLDEPFNSKVQSMVPYIELHGDKLWTVADLRLNEPLTPEEMAELKEHWEGQLSDGWGEGFEQREIKVNRGDLYVEPWSAEREFFIDTQAEFDRRMGIERPAPEESLPELHPDDLIDNMESELFPRLDRNLSDYCESIVNTDKRELIGMAEEIATRFAVRDYLKNDHSFKAPELELLLGFSDPLEVVCDHTPPISRLLEMSGAISELANLEGALRREYTRADDRAAVLDSLADREALLTQIAKKHCRVETLDERKSDSLDFHEVSVWGLKAALEDAFKAGAAHQPAWEKNQAAPEATPSEPEEPGQEEILLARLEENLADMMNDLRSDISDAHLPTSEFVSLADRVTAVSSAYEYLTDHTLPQNQVEYLLNFQNPLEMVANRWPVAKDDLLDFSMVLEDVMADSCSIDPTANDPVVEDTPQEPPPQKQHTAGKPSLLASLREAQARVASQKQNDKPNIQQSGPKL